MSELSRTVELANPAVTHDNRRCELSGGYGLRGFVEPEAIGEGGSAFNRSLRISLSINNGSLSNDTSVFVSIAVVLAYLRGAAKR